MARRRLVALVFTLLAVSAACGREGSSMRSTERDRRTVPGLPPLLIASGRGVARFEAGRLTPVVGGLAAEAGRAMSDLAGGVVVNLHRPDGDSIIRVIDGKVSTIPTPPPGEVKRDEGATTAELMDVSVIDGEPALFYATCNRTGDEPLGDVVVHPIHSGRRRQIAEACLVEYSVARASFGGGLIVVSANSDLTEDFRFYRLDGTEVKLDADPSNNLPYNSPPYLTQAVLSPDGKRLAYLEGPDSSGLMPDQVFGSWRLVVRDLSTGKNVVLVEIDTGRRNVRWLDYDGRWAITSVQSRTGARYWPAVAVDTASLVPKPITLEGIAGLVTIDERSR